MASDIDRAVVTILRTDKAGIEAVLVAVSDWCGVMGNRLNDKYGLHAGDEYKAAEENLDAVTERIRNA